MRVLTVVSGLTIGGAELGLLKLIQATKHEFEHHVVSLSSGGEVTDRIRALEVPTVEMGFKKSRPPLRRLWAFFRHVQRVCPDVVVGRMYHGALAAGIARKLVLRRTPVIWNIHHSIDRLSSERLSTRVAVRGCCYCSSIPTKIVYVSKRSSQQHEQLGFPRPKTIVIPNGYDTDRIACNGAARTRLRAFMRFNPDDIVLGHVARVAPMKDHVTAISAFATALTNDPRLALVFVGAGTEDLKIPTEIRHRVRLLGQRSDVTDIMSACDIGYLSSRNGEAFPNVIAEFMLCRRLCVATDVGDTTALISDFGVVVPPENPAMLAGAIARVASLPASDRLVAGANARRHIEQQFSMSRIANAHAAVWQEAVNSALV